MMSIGRRQLSQNKCKFVIKRQPCVNDCSNMMHQWLF
jgi:hypothetical protein